MLLKEEDGCVGARMEVFMFACSMRGTGGGLQRERLSEQEQRERRWGGKDKKPEIIHLENPNLGCVQRERDDALHGQARSREEQAEPATQGEWSFHAHSLHLWPDD